MKNSKSQIQNLKADGLIIIRSFFTKRQIKKVLSATKAIFKIQFINKKYPESRSKEIFKDNMVRLFNQDFETFQNCGKIVQSGLYELYHLAYSKKLKRLLKKIGLNSPLICTRPVLFFNHKLLAKKKEYYKTPRHQDFPSMLSSSDSVVVWIPLVDVDKKNGAVIFYPKSHKLGAVPLGRGKSGFAECPKPKGIKPVQPKMSIGDIAIFSTFLIHESGNISNDTIRWSCHFRYTNMQDSDFISRGFPSPYIYKSIAGERKT